MEALKSPAEQRVLLRNVSWETYERLIAEREERPVPRFFYDRGVLEIVSPSTRHEEISRVTALLIELLAMDLEIDVFDSGSTTFKRADLVGGFEPDSSFYFRDAAERVRGKTNIDLDAGEPPPDLVIEVDITRSSLNKLPVYARVGVPEVWRYAGGRFEILGLRWDPAGEEELRYEPLPESHALPSLTSAALARLVEGGLTSRRPDWVREVRGWARRGRRPEGQDPDGG